ncbi:MAG: hypothetical protein P8J37_10675 [Fuerstiella sp.]|nr:hypothetical protein [Fuerstiella sp.]
MSDISIFIFGMFVFAVAIASSMVSVIGTSRPESKGDGRNQLAEKDERLADVAGPLAPKSL